MTLRSRRKRPTTRLTTANSWRKWIFAGAVLTAALAGPVMAAEPAKHTKAISKPAAGTAVAPAPAGWRSAKKSGVAPAVYETERTGYDENIVLVAGAEPARGAAARPATKGAKPAPRVAAAPGQIQDVDPLDDPFVDPFAQAAPGSPAAETPATRVPATPKRTSTPARTPASNSSRVIRSQPLTLPQGDEDEGGPVLEPMEPAEPASPRGQPARQPREVQNPPTLRTTPRTIQEQSQEDADYPCPDPSTFKQLDQISLRLDVDGLTPKECTLDNQTWLDRCFCELTYTWKASSLCSKPLYFEDEQLERYGRMRYPLLQPAISGVRFYADLALLPYQAGVENPRECVYALGYYRPGSCAPRFRKTLRPINIEGVIYEAAVIGGLIALVP